MNTLPLFVRNSNWLQPIPPSDILFVQSSGNYCEIHTSDRKFVVKRSLVTVLELLPSDTFMQVHRSYLVRLDAITRINTTANEIEINEHLVPIGRKYRESFMECLEII